MRTFYSIMLVLLLGACSPSHKYHRYSSYTVKKANLQKVIVNGLDIGDYYLLILTATCNDQKEYNSPVGDFTGGITDSLTNLDIVDSLNRPISKYLFPLKFHEDDVVEFTFDKKSTRHLAGIGRQINSIPEYLNVDGSELRFNLYPGSTYYYGLYRLNYGSMIPKKVLLTIAGNDKSAPKTIETDVINSSIKINILDEKVLKSMKSQQ